VRELGDVEFANCERAGNVALYGLLTLAKETQLARNRRELAVDSFSHRLQLGSQAGAVLSGRHADVLFEHAVELWNGPKT